MLHMIMGKSPVFSLFNYLSVQNKFYLYRYILKFPNNVRPNCTFRLVENSHILNTDFSSGVNYRFSWHFWPFATADYSC